jgi:F-type H+-transporting ATPase subunit epsilon
MARTPFRVEVLTPEGEVFNDDVEMVSTHTAVGSVGILAHHQPMLAMLDPAELRLHRTEGDILTFAQGEGFLQVTGTRALLLVDELQDPATLDAADLRERLRSAQDQLAGAADDSEEQRVAKRDERRYATWLKIVEGSGRH